MNHPAGESSCKPGTFNNGFGPENPHLDADNPEAPGDTTVEHAFRVVDAGVPPVARHGRRITACAAAEIPPGGKRIIDSEGLSIGVFNIDGQFYALKNVCPHAGAPLCAGHIQTTHRPSAVGVFEPALVGRVLRCPWHGWEFDIPTGKGLYDRNSRVATYATELDADGNVVVLL